MNNNMIKTSDMQYDFQKAKNTVPAARVFLRFSQVSQHPACLDHSIQTREPIWYFLPLATPLYTIVHNVKSISLLRIKLAYILFRGWDTGGGMECFGPHF